MPHDANFWGSEQVGFKDETHIKRYSFFSIWIIFSLTHQQPLSCKIILTDLKRITLVVNMLMTF